MKKLVDIVEKLRSPDGCPWDRKQSHASLLSFLLEETWEVIEEIKNGKVGAPLKEELGDLLLQIVLHAQIAKEENRFGIDDVVDYVSEKMVRRHPHVFDSKFKNITPAEQKELWQEIKAEEKQHKSVLDGISSDNPSLINSMKIGQRAASIGFDWDSPWDVFSKIQEELSEVEVEMQEDNRALLEEEIGDLLFAVGNLARFYKINPEIALKRCNDKFKKRFSHVEKEINSAKEKGERLSLDEMERVWQSAKKFDKK